MTEQESIKRFVQDQLAKGRSRDEINAFLATKGIAYTEPVVAQKQKKGLVRSAIDFVAKDVFGGGVPESQIGGQGVLRDVAAGIFQNTLGSKGLAGVAQMPGKAISQPFMANAAGQSFDAAGQTADNARLMAQKARTAQTPEERERLLSASRSTFNQSLTQSTEGQNLANEVLTPRKTFGTSANAAITASTLFAGSATPVAGGITGKVDSAARYLGGTTQTPMRTAVAAGTVRETIKQRALHAFTTGTYAGFVAPLAKGMGLSENKFKNFITEEVPRLAANALLTGAFTSAFSTSLNLGSAGFWTTVKKVDGPFAEWLFKNAMPFDKKTRKFEERSNQMGEANNRITRELMKDGAGTARSLNTRYNQIIQSESTQVERILQQNTDAMYNTDDIIESVRSKLFEKFGDNLSPEDINAIILKIPFERLRNGGNISAAELNKLRSSIDTNFLGDAAFGKDIISGSTISLKDATRMASDVIRNIIKTDIPETAPHFARMSAAFKGSEATTALLTSGSMSKFMAGAERVALGTIGGVIGGSVAGKEGAAWGASLALGADILARTTWGRTMIAIALKNAGMKIEQFNASQYTQLIEALMRFGFFTEVGQRMYEAPSE